MEWNEKNIFRIFFPPSCLGVLTERMDFPFPCLRVQVGGNGMVKREYSFPPKPSKSQIFVPPKQGGIGGNGFSFNENFIEIPKLPLESQPSLFSTSRTNTFALCLLCLLSHAAANHNQPYPTISFSIVLISLIYLLLKKISIVLFSLIFFSTSCTQLYVFCLCTCS